MAAQILQNSGGCFLWASIVCSELELREVTSEKDVEELLGSIPSDMDALYTKILHDTRFGKDLAKAFMTWTTYGFCPVTTLEMQEPIEMETSDKTDDVDRAISKCCGNILHVDTHKRVQLVHFTAGEFLMNVGIEPEFVASKADGHRQIAKVCLQYLIQSDHAAAKPEVMRLGSDPEIKNLHSSLSEAVRPRRLHLTNGETTLLHLRSALTSASSHHRRTAGR